AVTMATPPADVPVELVWPLPSDWSCAPVTVRVEANTEGDYDDAWGPTQYPTPTLPDGTWDTWAIFYGTPYRGQPSVVYELTVDPTTLATVFVATPTVSSRLDGTPGTTPMDDTISDDPIGAPGSGADRLRMGTTGYRLTVGVERR